MHSFVRIFGYSCSSSSPSSQAKGDECVAGRVAVMRNLGQNSMVLGLRHALSAFHTLEATANIGQPRCRHCSSCLKPLSTISIKDIGSNVQAVRL